MQQAAYELQQEIWVTHYRPQQSLVTAIGNTKLLHLSV